MLSQTRHILKRRIQALLYDFAGIEGLLDEREQHALESHMGFRGQIPEHRRFQICELRKLGLMRSSSVLEIGCGPLTAGLPVIGYLDPNGYVGVDVRASVLDESWKQVGKAHLGEKNPRLIRSDDFGNDVLGDQKFDFIWAFSVLFHLSDELVERLFEIAADRLAVGGKLVANIQTTEENSTWLEFPFLNRAVDFFSASASRSGLHTKALGTLAERGFRDSGAESLNVLLQFSRESR